jgi:hypothetical protein
MPEDVIIACAKCGGKNRIPDSALGNFTNARCGHCGEPLSTSSIAEAAGIRTAVIDPVPKRHPWGRWVAGTVLASAASAAVYFWPGNEYEYDVSAGRDPNASLDVPVVPPPEPVAEPSPGPLASTDVLPDIDLLDPLPSDPFTGIRDPNVVPEAFPPLAEAPLAPPSVTLVPETVYPGILYDWTGAEALAPFTVVTSPGQNYYVKLVYEGTDTAAVGIFVEGGVSNEVLIPLGRYEMRYASGTTWYGLANLFGPQTVYSRALEVLDFHEETDQYTGYTIELILQEGGNLSTEGMAAADF